MQANSVHSETSNAPDQSKHSEIVQAAGEVTKVAKPDKADESKADNKDDGNQRQQTVVVKLSREATEMKNLYEEYLELSANDARKPDPELYGPPRQINIPGKSPKADELRAQGLEGKDSDGFGSVRSAGEVANRIGNASVWAAPIVHFRLSAQQQTGVDEAQF